MPFLDLERFIEESIDSVLAQTYTDWELLLIDDGSTDGSTGIARRYAHTYPDRIRYLAHDGRQNRGASASRNLGIRHARGEFIALLDADDVWLPHKLEQQVPLLDAHPEVGSLYGSTLHWYSWTNEEQDRGRDFVAAPLFPPGSVLRPPEFLVANLTGKAPAPCTCSILMRRSIVEKVAGFEDAFLRVFTDHAFYAKLFLEAPVLIAADCWDWYRRHDDSACSIADREGQLAARHLEYLTWLGAYMEKEGHAHGELKQAWDRALWLHQHPRIHRLAQGARGLPEATVEALRHRLLPLAFRASRVVLPRSLRHWIWVRWQNARAARSASRPPDTRQDRRA